MLQFIDPRPLAHEQLMLRRLRPAPDDDYSVRTADLCVGRIMRTRRSFQVSGWFWSVTGPSFALRELAGIPTSGYVGNLREAKTALRCSFDMWMQWALDARTRGERVAWHA